MDETNALLTGLHRSGTTLVCHLLNKLPETVALHEPMRVGRFARLNTPEAIRSEIDRFLEKTRESIIRHGTAFSKHIEGQIPDNDAGKSFSPRVRRLLNHIPGPLAFRLVGKIGLRQSRTTRGLIRIAKPLSNSFLLVIKHPAAFTAVLEHLIDYYPCYAIVRNPLAILASWNSVKFKWDGRAPVAEGIDRALYRALEQTPKRIDRQLRLLEWFFRKYKECPLEDHMLRYEDIIATRGKALQVITEVAGDLDENLENRNFNKLYDPELIPVLASKLLKSNGDFWEYYSAAEVKSLLSKYQESISDD